MQLASHVSSSLSLPLAWGMPMGYEWIIIGAIGLLIFGKRLPGAAKGIGQTILEFKKGMNAKTEDDSDSPATNDLATDDRGTDDRAKVAAAPRFDPQTGKPLQ